MPAKLVILDVITRCNNILKQSFALKQYISLKKNTVIVILEEKLR